MTYLIIGNNKENISENIRDIITHHWDKEVGEDILDIPSPDIHYINSSNINTVGIKDVKELQTKMIYSPYSELAQIAIIFDAEKLTPEAQNSFLKTLEDSTDNSVYIFTTKNEKNLLPTIISRSSKIYTKENKKDSIDFKSHEILRKNLVEAFSEIEGIAKERESTEKFLDELQLFYQQNLEQLVMDGKHTKQIYDNIQQIVKTKKRVDANGNRRLLLENLFLVLTR